eukprot:COSAG06_NODE_3650_length_5069_cov_2.380483_5_plen_144_part_01
MPSLRALMAALLAARCCGGGTASSDIATQRVYRASLAAGSGVSLITDDTDTRAYVREVVEGSTADVAGLSIEDELLSVGGLVPHRFGCELPSCSRAMGGKKKQRKAKARLKDGKSGNVFFKYRDEAFARGEFDIKQITRDYNRD